MQTLILLLTFVSTSLFAQEETYQIKHVRMGTTYAISSGQVILKSDSILSIYLNGTEENTFIQDVISKNRIPYLNEYWYKSTTKDCYIALYRNPKLYKVGIYIPNKKVTYWIEN